MSILTVNDLLTAMNGIANAMSYRQRLVEMPTTQASTQAIAAMDLIVEKLTNHVKDAC